MRRNLVLFLQREGLDVAVASNGRQALCMAPEIRPSVIVLEADFDDVSGLNICQCLTEMPQTCGIPVILFTPDPSRVSRRPPGPRGRTRRSRCRRTARTSRSRSPTPSCRCRFRGMPPTSPWKTDRSFHRWSRRLMRAVTWSSTCPGSWATAWSASRRTSRRHSASWTRHSPGRPGSEPCTAAARAR
ncbi:MAG: response regulator [Candidatus Sericytochromatia bacterium]|uniref:Response regulator n=1 Tax=Candidatus Tanganyikabacteria bacterium TaxID=2961651 RepID=A0A938BME2_9BACT|nr:response regulator [Candidatus Tanganyikabacteria bacterium]